MYTTWEWLTYSAFTVVAASCIGVIQRRFFESTTYQSACTNSSNARGHLSDTFTPAVILDSASEANQETDCRLRLDASSRAPAIQMVNQRASRSSYAMTVISRRKAGEVFRGIWCRSLGGIYISTGSIWETDICM
ncbi:hypothetical protein BC835DRAFT_1388471 [Cytidiella melzeri]|nr:hypothetical protein BC835DRAFT_1388471 [Cytidiella melzeri]